MKKRLIRVFLLAGLLLMLDVPAVYGQGPDRLSVPIRWCVVANDTNGNGEFDAGEEGAPAFTDPGNVGESDTDNVLWRRHERISEATFIPQANITLRSALYNIVQDTNLSFPIIPDQDTSDPDHEVGDILLPDPTNNPGSEDEWNATYNACVDAWRDDHGVGDIGIVAVNARKIVDGAGDEAVFAVGWLNGARKVLLEDNAWSLPGSGMKTAAVGDAVDKTLGHEVGHTLPTDPPSGSSVEGLRHTCDNTTNIMRQGRRDSDGDDLLNNSNLSDSIAHVTNKGADEDECTADDTTEIVDQITAVYEAAQTVPGCKIAGTNTDCSSVSDVRTDAVMDVADPFLDISMLVVTEPDSADKTEFAHELFGLFTDEGFNQFLTLDYFVLADLDNDAATGGMPADLGIPSTFQGAELVTRVRVAPFIVDRNGVTGQAEARPRVWKFDGATFVEVFDSSIIARVNEQIASVDSDSDEDIELHTSDTVLIEFSNAVRGPANVPIRVQALSRGVKDTGPDVIDRLDDRTGEPGLEIFLEPPTFPVCSVNPDPATTSQSATVAASGLLPNMGVHVIFGDKEVATASTDANGAATVAFEIPSDAIEGPHLVTVGVEGTALTADCIVDVLVGPTAIDLSSFIARAGADRITLAWETASEIDNEGFNLLRSEAVDGPYTKINPSLIPAQGNSDVGASYEYADTNVVKGVIYYYKLEDVDTFGVSTFHGPVSASPSQIRQIYLPLILK